MFNRRRGRDGERGQVLVVVAGGVIVLLLLMGLALDGGIALFNRRDAQNASDTMALAGTKFVADIHQGKPTQDADTFAAIQRSAGNNDCAAAGAVPCTWQAWFVQGGASGPVDIGPVNSGAGVPSNALGVRVAVRRQPGTFIVGLVGIHDWDVNTQATATAEVSSSIPVGELLPIALKDDGTGGIGYKPGQVVDLTDGKDIPGGFGYVAWFGTNDPNSLATSICTPNNPAYTLPFIVDGDPGKSNSSSVRACLQKWIDSGQPVLIPIYDVVTGPGNKATYRIVAIASFVLTSKAQPAVDNIRGYFVGTYDANPVPGGTGSRPPTADDTSMYFGLVR